LNSILKETDKDESATTETTRAMMSFVARDVYGKKMLEDAICSFFSHNRFIIYFNVVFVNPNPRTDLANVKIAMDETFDIQTSIKKFSIDAIRPIKMTF
jgi:hypothetical protein